MSSQAFVGDGNIVPMDPGISPAMAETPPDTPAGAAEPLTKGVNDQEFIDEVKRLQNLSTFCNQEAVFLGLLERDSEVMGELFTLYAARGGSGRAPLGREWTAVSRLYQLMFQRLSEPQRKRFLVGGISPNVASMPVKFAIGALASLLGALVAIAFAAQTAVGSQSFLLLQLMVVACYVCWLMSLGAIGSMAFIGMNALSVQQDITFDLLNPRLINLRVALGALFALVLALPFGFDGFRQFLFNLVGNQGQLDGTQALMLIVPFLLGFSTSLVIMVLNRMLEAAQSFFGKTVVTTAPTTSNPASSMPTTTHVGGTGWGGSKTRRRTRSNATVSA